MSNLSKFDWETFDIEKATRHELIQVLNQFSVPFNKGALKSQYKDQVLALKVEQEKKSIASSNSKDSTKKTTKLLVDNLSTPPRERRSSSIVTTPKSQSPPLRSSSKSNGTRSSMNDKMSPKRQTDTKTRDSIQPTKRIRPTDFDDDSATDKKTNPTQTRRSSRISSSTSENKKDSKSGDEDGDGEEENEDDEEGDDGNDGNDDDDDEDENSIQSITLTPSKSSGSNPFQSKPLQLASTEDDKPSKTRPRKSQRDSMSDSTGTASTASVVVKNPPPALGSLWEGGKTLSKAAKSIPLTNLELLERPAKLRKTTTDQTTTDAKKLHIEQVTKDEMLKKTGEKPKLSEISQAFIQDALSVVKASPSADTKVRDSIVETPKPKATAIITALSDTESDLSDADMPITKIREMIERREAKIAKREAKKLDQLREIERALLGGTDDDASVPAGSRYFFASSHAELSKAITKDSDAASHMQGRTKDENTGFESAGYGSSLNLHYKVRGLNSHDSQGQGQGQGHNEPYQRQTTPGQGQYQDTAVETGRPFVRVVNINGSSADLSTDSIADHQNVSLNHSASVADTSLTSERRKLDSESTKQPKTTADSFTNMFKKWLLGAPSTTTSPTKIGSKTQGSNKKTNDSNSNATRTLNSTFNDSFSPNQGGSHSSGITIKVSRPHRSRSRVRQSRSRSRSRSQSPVSTSFHNTSFHSSFNGTGTDSFRSNTSDHSLYESASREYISPRSPLADMTFSPYQNARSPQDKLQEAYQRTKHTQQTPQPQPQPQTPQSRLNQSRQYSSFSNSADLTAQHNTIYEENEDDDDYLSQLQAESSQNTSMSDISMEDHFNQSRDNFERSFFEERSNNPNQNQGTRHQTPFPRESSSDFEKPAPKSGLAKIFAFFRAHMVKFARENPKIIRVAMFGFLFASLFALAFAGVTYFRHINRPVFCDSLPATPPMPSFTPQNFPSCITCPPSGLCVSGELLCSPPFDRVGESCDDGNFVSQLASVVHSHCGRFDCQSSSLPSVPRVANAIISVFSSFFNGITYILKLFMRYSILPFANLLAPGATVALSTTELHPTFVSTFHWISKMVGVPLHLFLSMFLSLFFPVSDSEAPPTREVGQPELVAAAYSLFPDIPSTNLHSALLHFRRRVLLHPEDIGVAVLSSTTGLSSSPLSQTPSAASIAASAASAAAASPTSSMFISTDADKYLSLYPSRPLVCSLRLWLTDPVHLTLIIASLSLGGYIFKIYSRWSKQRQFRAMVELVTSQVRQRLIDADREMCQRIVFLHKNHTSRPQHAGMGHSRSSLTNGYRTQLLQARDLSKVPRFILEKELVVDTRLGKKFPGLWSAVIHLLSNDPRVIAVKDGGNEVCFIWKGRRELREQRKAERAQKQRELDQETRRALARGEKITWPTVIDDFDDSITDFDVTSVLTQVSSTPGHTNLNTSSRFNTTQGKFPAQRYENSMSNEHPQYPQYPQHPQPSRVKTMFSKLNPFSYFSKSEHQQQPQHQHQQPSQHQFSMETNENFHNQQYSQAQEFTQKPKMVQSIPQQHTTLGNGNASRLTSSVGGSISVRSNNPSVPNRSEQRRLSLSNQRTSNSLSRGSSTAPMRSTSNPSRERPTQSGQPQHNSIHNQYQQHTQYEPEQKQEQSNTFFARIGNMFSKSEPQTMNDDTNQHWVSGGQHFATIHEGGEDFNDSQNELFNEAFVHTDAISVPVPSQVQRQPSMMGHSNSRTPLQSRPRTPISSNHASVRASSRPGVPQRMPSVARPVARPLSHSRGQSMAPTGRMNTNISKPRTNSNVPFR